MSKKQKIFINWFKISLGAYLEPIKKNVPILIAIFALIVSIYSAHLTRQTFIADNRPYVWAANYAVPDSKSSTINYLPYMVGFRVTNAPARITSLEIYILLDNETLFSDRGGNYVRFPDERSEWTFSIGKEMLDEILIKYYLKEESTLKRIIYIDYSSLNGGKTYHFELIQSFDERKNIWIDETEDSN